MKIELTDKQFRRLLDMVYIGNWILNSARGDDRFADYDDLESKLFALCREQGMGALVERYEGADVPSRAFSDGGILIDAGVSAKRITGALENIGVSPDSISTSSSVISFFLSARRRKAS